ncbi:hypothetical protein BBX50_17020 [Ensifer sp. LC11]|nr:hypothetical protein BBX50_17020 [Ensifer sp. LC11]
MKDELSRAREAILQAIKLAEKSVQKVAIGVAAIIVLIALSHSLTGNETSTATGLFLRALATSGAAVFAASCAGYAIGFLFGIPKLLQRGTDKIAGARDDIDRSSKKLFYTNTSLEEISDWLTKIIIGLGLVQFDKLIYYIKYASDVLAAFAFGNGTDACPPRQQPCTDPAAAFFFSLIVGCLILALILGYLQTRTRLTLMFLGVEGVNMHAAAEFEKAAMTPLVVPNEPTATRQRQPGTLSQPSDEDKKLAQFSIENLRSPMQIAGWASALVRTGGSPQISEDALRTALQSDPTNPEILMRLAEVRKLTSNYPGYVSTAVDLVHSPRANKSEISALVMDALLDALYLKAPFGYEKAIVLANYLLDTGPEMRLADRPIVLLWRATAYAQKYEHLTSQGSADAAGARRNALAEARKLVDLVPDRNAETRRLLREMYDPETYGGLQTDNDFEVFKGDPDFERVIVQGKLD